MTLDNPADMTQGELMVISVGLFVAMMLMLAFLEFQEVKGMIQSRTMFDIVIPGDPSPPRSPPRDIPPKPKAS